MKSLICSAILLMSTLMYSQTVPVWKWSDMEKQLQIKDTLLVMNFWATWCKPCLKELPYFEKAHETFKDKPVKVVLVSLDFKRELDSRLKPFVAEWKLKSKVVMLNEPDYNSWIDRVDSSWSGAIPSTLMLNNTTGSRTFFEKEFDGDELNKEIEKRLEK